MRLWRHSDMRLRRIIGYTLLIPVMLLTDITSSEVDLVSSRVAGKLDTKTQLTRNGTVWAMNYNL